MPQQLLKASPTYVGVGIYRTLHDPALRQLVFKNLGKGSNKLLYLLPLYSFFAIPVTFVFSQHMVSRSPLSEFNVGGWGGHHYMFLSLFLSQVTYFIEFFLSSNLREARKHAFHETVKSRGKDASFWQPYTEEWAKPAESRVHQRLHRPWYVRFLKPFIVQWGVTLAVAPFAWIPFFGLIVVAFSRTGSYSHWMLQSYFEMKKMSKEQQELFFIEHEAECRSLAFVCSLLEGMPIVGIFFRVSDQVGIAMFVHDLEKRQHRYASGELERTKEYAEGQTNITDIPTDIAQAAGPGLYHLTKKGLGVPDAPSKKSIFSKLKGKKE